MKIAYIVSSLKRSGPINVLKSLIKHIDNKENEIFIIALSPESELSLKEEFISLGINYLNLNTTRVNLIKTIKRLRYTIEKIKPDIIHTHGFRPDFLCVLFLSKNFNLCSTIHNYAPMDYKMTYGNFIGSIISYIHLRIMKRIRYAISCSYAIRNILNKKHKIDTYVIQNGIDLEHFIPVDNSYKEKLRRKFKLPLDKKIIISSGVFIEIKNQITILKAFAKSNILDNFIILFLGDGPLRDNLEEISKKFFLPCRFEGYVNNVVEYLQASDYFISASLSEGLPTAVLEAGAVGLPLILSDIPQHREILPNDSLAYFFLPKDVDQLTYIFNKLGKEKWDNYLNKSYATREIIINNFSAQKMAMRYIDFYNKIKRENLL